MLLEYSTAFALRCPTCGRLDTDKVHIFDLSGNKKHDIFCECGTKKASITRMDARHIKLDYYCIICEEEHSVIITASDFWSKNHLNTLVCTNTNLNLGYYGPHSLLKKELRKQQEELDSMANDLGFDDFVDPELMLEVLDYLHDAAAAGKLVCECGSHNINIELFSDSLELSCNNCGAKLSISASSENDLKKLRMSDEIVLKYNPGNKKKEKPNWMNSRYKEE